MCHKILETVIIRYNTCNLHTGHSSEFTYVLRYRTRNRQYLFALVSIKCNFKM